MRLCTITIPGIKVLLFSLDNCTKLGPTCRLLLPHFVCLTFIVTYLDEEHPRTDARSKFKDPHLSRRVVSRRIFIGCQV